MIDADAVAAAVEGVDEVERLGDGPFGEVATHLPGRRVQGVRERDGVIEVHVVLRWGTSLLDSAERVRLAVAQVVDGRPIDVVVDDVATPEVVAVP